MQTLFIAFLRTHATACVVLADGLAAAAAAQPAQPSQPSQPPVVTPPVVVAPILNETYAAFRARGGEFKSGPNGEVAQTSIFNGTNWVPVS